MVDRYLFVLLGRWSIISVSMEEYISSGKMSSVYIFDNCFFQLSWFLFLDDISNGRLHLHSLLTMHIIWSLIQYIIWSLFSCFLNQFLKTLIWFFCGAYSAPANSNWNLALLGYYFFCNECFLIPLSSLCSWA